MEMSIEFVNCLSKLRQFHSINSTDSWASEVFLVFWYLFNFIIQCFEVFIMDLFWSLKPSISATSSRKPFSSPSLLPNLLLTTLSSVQFPYCMHHRGPDKYKMFLKGTHFNFQAAFFCTSTRPGVCDSAWQPCRQLSDVLPMCRHYYAFSGPI